MVASCEEEQVMQTDPLPGRESEPVPVPAPSPPADTADNILEAFDKKFQCLVLAESIVDGAAEVVADGTVSRMNEEGHGDEFKIPQGTGNTDCDEEGKGTCQEGESLEVVGLGDKQEPENSKEGIMEGASKVGLETAAHLGEGADKVVDVAGAAIALPDEQHSDCMEVIITAEKKRPEEKELVIVMDEKENNIGQIECGEGSREEEKGGQENEKTTVERSEMEEAQKEAEAVNDKEGDAIKEQHAEGEASSYDKGWAVEEGNETQYCNFPQRPNAPDCAYYLKTGKCAYGLNCKFNHPLKGLQNGNIVYQVKNPLDTAELNFLGLPMRPGERECPYYMRNGLCKFSINCRFHHPDPTTSSGNGSSPAYNGAYHFPHPGALQLPVRPHPMPETYHNPAPRPHMPSYAPWMCQPPQILNPNSGLDGNQRMDPSFSTPRQPSPVSNSNHRPNSYNYHQPNPMAEFPQRYGQPDCQYYMKTGDCKYRSSCKFNHPKNRIHDPPRSPTLYHPKGRQQDPVSSRPLLNPLGLPLRPGQAICINYKHQGICKFGPSCKYDHPVNIPVQQGSKLSG